MRTGKHKGSVLKLVCGRFRSILTHFPFLFVLSAKNTFKYYKVIDFVCVCVIQFFTKPAKNGDMILGRLKELESPFLC